MSDLASFVAATIRDKVVLDQQEEINYLRAQLHHQRTLAQTISITGPGGKPIYIEAQLTDGTFDCISPELWKVEFPKSSTKNQDAIQNTDRRGHATLHNNSPSYMDNTPQSSHSYNPHNNNNHTNRNENNNNNNNLHAKNYASCAVAALRDIEIRIGGIVKAKFGPDETTNNGTTIVEGFVNDIYNNYNTTTKSGMVSIWFGGSAGIWLTLSIPEIERDQYAIIRDFDLSGTRNLFQTITNFWNLSSKVQFLEVSFVISHINGAMDQWKVLPGPEPTTARTT